MELKYNTRTRNSFSSSSSDRESSSVPIIPVSQTHHTFTPSTLSTTLTSVVELQTKYFPIQPRPGPKTEIRDVMSSSESSLSPTTGGAQSHPGKLKEPRDLYSTTTLLHPLKWPVECQVIPEKIRHIESNPQKCPKLEPFNSPTGKEPQPQPVGVEMGTIVYDYQPKLSVDYFCRATVGGSQDIDEFPISPHGPPSVGGADGAPQQTDLKFESRFESGNLAKAIKVTNTYYELHIRPDLYTDRHAQWFYFRIQNTRDNQSYRFSIVNFNKQDSLYRYGLKVLMYSEKDALLNGVGWVRAGQNITYFKNDISTDENGPYYTLTFNLKFGHNNDTVYLAQCYPYTYSTLQTYLKSIEDDEYKSQLLTIRLLCRSLAGNNVHVLTVTSPNTATSSSSTIHSPGDSGHGSHNSSTESEPSSSPQENNPQTQNKKPVIVISARVHPGETQSSYMMKGIIDFLTSSSAQAKTLRDRFIFKLIPMLNPDGVIVGNSRCCLLGQDLNRQYRTVLREAFPQIYHAKVMLRRLQEENGIFLYCDLHGHSRRHNVFIYGCENRRVPEKKLVEQVFPLMMHKNAADKFSFQNCKFKIQKNKEGTGRIFVWTLGVVNSYTLEISLGGSTMPSRQYTHFSTPDYEACGRHFCETLLDYSDSSPTKESLRDRILQKLIDEGSTADEPKNVQLSDYSSLSNSETEGEGDDDDDNDDEINQSTNPNDTSISSSTKLSPGILQVTNINGRPSKNQLKRQLSIRKHQPHQTRPIKSAALSRKSTLTSVDPINPTPPGRSPLPIHRASVDFTKMVTKQSKLEEALCLLAPPPPPSDNDISDDMENDRKNVLKDFSPSYRRLSKFRRKTKKSPSVSLETNSSSLSQQYQQAKCTTILFDDPFKPPNGTPRRHHHHHHHHGNKRSSQSQQISMSLANHSNSHQMDWLSGTEDECDPYDSKPVSFLAPSIKITDYGGGGVADDNVDEVLDDLQHLKLSEDCQVQTMEQPQYQPFIPSFPVGKAFLHQTCYPGKGVGGGGATPKLSSSHSDTKLSEQSGGSSRSPQPQRASVPSSRRSSISYLGGVGGGRLQATGSTIFGSGASSQGDLCGRRRVSWTGTLTVSVPTVPIPVTGVSMPRSPQRKKSFRKSKSLNDSNEMDGNGPGCQGSIATGVVRCGGGGGVLVTRSSSSSSSSKWMGSGGGGVRVGGLKYFGMNGSSSGGGGMVHNQQQSKVGKKRGKLKRSKHK